MKTYRREYVEILEIINHLDNIHKEKIPYDKIKLFEKYKDPNYEFNFDITKNINEQKILRQTYIIFVKLYLDYIANKHEKEKINEILKLNTLKNDNEKQTKYNANNLFSNKENNKKNFSENSITPIKKEKWYVKIFNCIKHFLIRDKSY